MEEFLLLFTVSTIKEIILTQKLKEFISFTYVANQNTCQNQLLAKF